jgi:hypothetical protein
MLRLLRLAVLITSVLLAREELVRAADQPKKEQVKITVTAEKTPFTEDIKFAEKDCFIIMLPNGKAVALWAEKDRFAFGEQQTKSGLQCMWGEKPFALEPPKKDAYIEQGSVITSTRARLPSMNYSSESGNSRT